MCSLLIPNEICLFEHEKENQYSSFKIVALVIMSQIMENESNYSPLEIQNQLVSKPSLAYRCHYLIKSYLKYPPQALALHERQEPEKLERTMLGSAYKENYSRIPATVRFTPSRHGRNCQPPAPLSCLARIFRTPCAVLHALDSRSAVLLDHGSELRLHRFHTGLHGPGDETVLRGKPDCSFMT